MINTDLCPPFQLDEDFLADYRDRPVPWGFGDLSWFTFKRTYARPLRPSYVCPDRDQPDQTEDWWQTCKRVVQGAITVQKIRCISNHLPWNPEKAQRFAQEMYARLFAFKWTPPGRGLWMMGTDFMFDRTGAPLNNCGFISTENIGKKGRFSEPFGWSFEMSMLGVGVGFDTRGIGERTIQKPRVILSDTHVIEDSREGWRQAIERLLNAYVGEADLPQTWDYSHIRPKGAPIKSFGGTASGPAPLEKAIETLTALYDFYIGHEVDAELIVDTMNITGKCVVAGGVRRTAQIALGERDDEQFMDLKTDPEKVGEYRWASNNSVFAQAGMDYSEVAERTATNGEPGYMWLENARTYGRMADPPNHKDAPVMGGNPCLEQSLHDAELCCLVETYPAHHDSLEDFKETLRVAYQYAKTVTLAPTHEKKTNAVMLKNRRIGCSMTGIVQAINKHGYREFMGWCDEGYGYIQELDKKYSDWLCIPRSIKTTSCKPSGTVSLLAGATPGVHWGHAPHYIRRVRVRDTHEVIDLCREAGYHVEPDTYADDTVVIEFPIAEEHLGRGKHDVPLWEKVKLAADMQYWWADNQVSCTAEFDPDTEGDQIERLLEMFESSLKGISFLPNNNHGYVQAPYETITAEEYAERMASIEPLQRTSQITRDQEDKFCDGEACVVDLS